jgi:hypothetical protein
MAIGVKYRTAFAVALAEFERRMSERMATHSLSEMSGASRPRRACPRRLPSGSRSASRLETSGG